jgi:transposase-like protein
MKRNERRHLLEDERGRPLRDIVASALAEYPTVTAAAASLGVHSNTMYYWMRLYGVRIRRVVQIERSA